MRTTQLIKSRRESVCQQSALSKMYYCISVNILAVFKTNLLINFCKFVNAHDGMYVFSPRHPLPTKIKKIYIEKGKKWDNQLKTYCAIFARGYGKLLTVRYITQKMLFNKMVLQNSPKKFTLHLKRKRFCSPHTTII